MGIYSEYLNKKFDFQQLTQERKKQLKAISALRGGRDIIVYASDVNNKANAPTGIDFSDILIFQDQLANLKGKAIDVIIETPGGIAEAVEDMVRQLRNKYDHVGIIVPGMAKSAGTIWAMAGDEILMGEISALGPIDAQIFTPNGKRFSADAFLEGLDKIKKEVASLGKLNPAYIPVLQNISPGEIQHAENAQTFSKKLVTQWLAQYKFKYWDTHSTTGKPVEAEEKEMRAKEIAETLCKHSDWLTHARSITIEDLENMKLQIIDYRKNVALNEAITRYYTLLKITFDTTNMYKLVEIPETQVYRHTQQAGVPVPVNAAAPGAVSSVVIDFECAKCKTHSKILAKFDKNVPNQPGTAPYPKNDIFACGQCHTQSNISNARLQIEAQTGKKIIF